MIAQDKLSAFSSAGQMLQALRDRQISARELLDAHLRRCQRFEPALNSIVVRDFERAIRDAERADERRARGDDGALLGLPVTIKESVDVEGLPSTAGVADRVGHRAVSDAKTVSRLRAAGAVVIGKTNVCTWLADYQADNVNYGRTNNPWNLQRTSGGSSGGSATLAAGLTALDWGSDLGGSIRVPAAFCGLWGHKPSQGIVPATDHFPGSEFPNPALPLAVQGPHGRSAADLELALDVTAGPEAGWENGVALATASCAAAQQLSEFRVAVLPLQSWLPVDAEIASGLERVANCLRNAGAKVTERQPAALGELRDYYRLFRSMMSATVSMRWSNDRREEVAADKLTRGDKFHNADARGILASGAQFLQWHERREAYRAAWREFFTEWDVLITPITLTPAFEHTAVPNADRRLLIGGKQVEFEYMSFYPGLATLTGQPATVFPCGCNTAGLPLGLQAIGPFLEDRTTLGLARLLEQEFCGFSSPSGYDGELN